MLRSILPAEAARLRVTTFRATIPTSSTPSTAIQVRPRVIRTIRLESGRCRTAVAVPTAIGINCPPGRRVGARRAGRRDGDAFRAGTAVPVLDCRVGAALPAAARRGPPFPGGGAFRGRGALPGGGGFAGRGGGRGGRRPLA